MASQHLKIQANQFGESLAKGNPDGKDRASGHLPRVERYRAIAFLLGDVRWAIVDLHTAELIARPGRPFETWLLNSAADVAEVVDALHARAAK